MCSRCVRECSLVCASVFWVMHTYCVHSVCMVWLCVSWEASIAQPPPYPQVCEVMRRLIRNRSAIILAQRFLACKEMRGA